MRIRKTSIVGANEDDHHYKNVNLKDFTPTAVADLTEVMEGDICPKCGQKLTFEHGIEVGNLFKLGTKYSQAMNLLYLDQNNKLEPVWMGSYGIGLERCMAAVADQYHDENGLMWPDDLAPFRAGIVIVNMKDEQQVEQANKFYEYAKSQGMDLLLDDRNERAGVKFKDMELIGIPHRFTFGKGVAQGKVEYVLRKTGEKVEVAIEDLPALLNKIYNR